jgi:hypothetical protein
MVFRVFRFISRVSRSLLKANRQDCQTKPHRIGDRLTDTLIEADKKETTEEGDVKKDQKHSECLLISLLLFFADSSHYVLLTNLFVFKLFACSVALQTHYPKQ